MFSLRSFAMPLARRSAAWKGAVALTRPRAARTFATVYSKDHEWVSVCCPSPCVRGMLRPGLALDCVDSTTWPSLLCAVHRCCAAADARRWMARRPRSASPTTPRSCWVTSFTWSSPQLAMSLRVGTYLRCGGGRGQWPCAHPVAFGLLAPITACVAPWPQRFVRLCREREGRKRRVRTCDWQDRGRERGSGG